MMINIENTPEELFSTYTPQKGASTYRSNFERNLSPYQILLELYRALLRNLDTAKNAYRHKDLSKMCAYNQKNFLILSALKDNIDRTEKSQLSEGLDKFYTIIFYRLVRILETNDPFAEFERLESSVRDVYLFWGRVGQRETTPNTENILGGHTTGTNFA